MWRLIALSLFWQQKWLLWAGTRLCGYKEVKPVGSRLTRIPVAHSHASICCSQVFRASPSPSAFFYVGKVPGEISCTGLYSSFLKLKNLHMFRLFVFKILPFVFLFSKWNLSCFPLTKVDCGKKKNSMVSHEDIFFTTDKKWQKLPKGPCFSCSFLSPRIISPLSLHASSLSPFPSQSGWHLLCRVVGTQLFSRARGTCFMFMPGCHTRWMTSPAQGLSTQSLSLPAQAFLPQESQCQLFWP